MRAETLYAATPYFRPFPEPATVFATDLARHAEHLLPLASVDLAHLSPEWTGWLHFVTPIEPEEGVVGAEAEPYHNYLCRPNWVGYRIKDGRYELATDFRFFRKPRLGISSITGESTAPDDDLALLYSKRHAGYRVQKERVARHGYLYHAWAKRGFFGYKRSDRCAMVNNLGSYAPDGNWAYGDDFPIGRFGEWIDADGTPQEKICPLTQDGRPFHFIGLISVNEYIRPTTDFPAPDTDLLLFYDPVDQIVLNTWDYS